MPLSRSTIHAALLLFPLFCAKPIPAQGKPHHPCFEQPNDARDAIHRLPNMARYWLVEDAVYIITPEERCAFLHLNTDHEREQFIEQFWYRRTAEDSDFETEHYRRIVFANEKYRGQLAGGGQLPGWKTDRGRIHVLFGPPDSVDLVTDQRAAGEAANRDADTHFHPAERWHYRYINGIGEDVEFHFEFVASHRDYALAPPDQFLLEQSNLYPDILQMPQPKVRFKDLEALVTARIVRDHVKFSHRIQFAAATNATTLARVDIQILCKACTHDGQTVPSVAYALFVRVSKLSGWVVHTSEMNADTVIGDNSHSRPTLTAHFDLPLRPGKYQLAIAAKNATTGGAGVSLTQLDVPTCESLETKKLRNHAPIRLGPG